MKKALQNPLIVGALAIVAVFIVFRSSFKQDPAAAPAAVQPPPASVSPNPTGVSASGVQQRKVDTALAQWVTTTPDRNPFDATDRANEKAQQEIETPKNSPRNIQPPALKLTAIWHDNQKQLAVLNDTVVARGDTLLDYQIEDILSDQVILNGSGGRLVVGFRDSPSSQKPSGERLADRSQKLNSEAPKRNP